jgi:hypothetical protein
VVVAPPPFPPAQGGVADHSLRLPTPLLLVSPRRRPRSRLCCSAWQEGATPLLLLRLQHGGSSRLSLCRPERLRCALARGALLRREALAEGARRLLL